MILVAPAPVFRENLFQLGESHRERWLVRDFSHVLVFPISSVRVLVPSHVRSGYASVNFTRLVLYLLLYVA